jgi:predicted alpha/beta hydrolase family esterase
MKRAIIIHAWEETPNGQWLPWLKEKLESAGWKVDVPEMPNTKEPKLNEWMDTLVSLSPDKNTVLIGHSLSNSLIMKYLERPEVKVRRVILVAAWDWMLENVRKFHQTFFEHGFNYEAIKRKQIPITIVNSTTDPWIDLERSKGLAKKLNAKFITVKNAGHFMARDGYSEFPLLIKLIK